MLSCIGVSAFILGISVTINTGIDMYHNAADMVSDPHAVFARHMKHMGIMVKAGIVTIIGLIMIGLDFIVNIGQTP